MGLNVSTLKPNIRPCYQVPSFREKENSLQVPKDVSENPVSRKGEAINMIKATFLGGLALGTRLLLELFDGDFLFEVAGKQGAKIGDKQKKEVAHNKKMLLYIGATVAIIAGAVSGFALLYTMVNAPKIAYNSKVSHFKKSKEMDVYIKANEAERELYSELDKEAKKSNPEEKEHLKEQYMQLKMAKNQVPDFVDIKKQPK